MFKDSPAQYYRSLYYSYFLFSLPIMAASRHNFCSLVLSVWLVSCYVFSIGKKFFTRRYCIVLYNSHYCSSYFGISTK